MRTVRLASIAAIAAAASLTLAACGSDSNSTTTSSSPDTTTSSSTSTDTGSSAPAGSIDCGSGALNSDGSTAQANAVAQWISSFKAQCSGMQVTYSGGGSGQGITDFTGGKVQFAGSDAALSEDKGEVDAANKQCGSPALDIPMVTGPIAVAYNVAGVTDLVLTPQLIAKIFTGKIKTWDDAAIKAENPNAKLPSANISVFFRSDESGTTQNFETYMNTVDPTDFTATPSKTWAGTGQGKSQSAGVATATKSTANSISYVEHSYARSDGLSMAQVDSGSGPVALTATSAGLAVAAAQPAPNKNSGDLSLKLDYTTKAKGAYPIILVTYEVVCSKYKNATDGKNVKAFLTYTSSAAGQAELNQVGSAPLPSSVLTKVQAAVASIS